MIAVLKAENVLVRRYFYPGTHRTIEYCDSFSNDVRSLPNTDHLCASCIQFPIGAVVDCNAVDTICEIVDKSHRNAHHLTQLLKEQDI